MPRSSRPLSRTPTAVNFDLNQSTMAQAREAWNTVADLLASVGDTAAPVTLRIENGVLDPTNAVIRVQVDDDIDPEDPSLGVDVVETISTANIANGRCIYLSIHDDNAPITFRHLVNGGAGTGELELSEGIDVVLTSRKEWIVLQREGSRFIERRPKPRPVRQFEQDINGAGKAIYDLRLKWVNVKAFVSGGVNAGDTRYMNSSGVYAVTTGDRGALLYFEAPGTLSLTNTLGAWRKGDSVYWAQGSTSLLFSTAGTLINPYNHDRGAGIGSMGAVMLADTTSPLKWWLNGATTSAAGTGGGGTEPPPVTIQRQWMQVSSTQTFTSTAGSTAYSIAGETLTHTPGDNEKWLYITRGTAKTTGDSLNNNSRFRLRNQAVAAGTNALIPAPGGTPHRPAYTDSAMIFLAESYGASPGIQSFVTELGGTSTITASWIRPAIVGLRLETGEFLLQDKVTTFVTTSGSTSFFDAFVPSAPTLLADDYLIIAWCGWDSNVLAGAKIRLLVGGVGHGERSMGKEFNAYGYWNTIVPYTGSGASVELKIQIACNLSSNTATCFDMNIVILKKSKFELWSVGDQSADQTKTDTAYSDRLSHAVAMKAGWNHLVLADFATKVSVDDAAAGVNVRLQQNGSNAHDAAMYGNKNAGTNSFGPQGFSNVRQPIAATDTFALQYASVRDGDTVTISHATIAVLALGPA